MRMLLGDTFPNFNANTTEGPIKFHDWVGDCWTILFSHPRDFTPVCTTELARLVVLYPQFVDRKVKLIGLSCDSVDSHKEWCKDICTVADSSLKTFPFPIIEDENRKVAKLLGMIDKDEVDEKGMPLSARALFIIDPDKKFRLSILYPATTGRNFNEILRVVDSLQLCDKTNLATPVDWKMGDHCMVPPNVSMDHFSGPVTAIDLPSGKSYFKKTPCPKI